MKQVDLRRLWERCVRAMTGVDDYQCWGFTQVFDRVGDLLAARPDIDPERYVRAQIHWVIGRNIEGGLLPSILSGEKAMQRYKAFSAPAQRRDQLGALLKWELETWNNLVGQLGLSLALTNPVRAHTSLFIAYMHYLAELDYPPGLRHDAWEQLVAEPDYWRVLPSDFLETIHE